jgi:DNA-binding CsgD family transcriptional regulator/PAS domain-containing protein
MADASALEEAEWVSHLIGQIYDAAVDPDLWTDVIGAGCTFLNAMCGSIAVADFVRSDINLAKTWGYEPAALKLFLEKYARNHPLSPSVMCTNVGDVFAIEDCMPYEEFVRTPYYREIFQPLGILDAMHTNLEKSPTSLAMFYVARHEHAGRVDDTARRRLALLYPHLRRAVLIGKLIDLHRIELASLADTLDGIAAGVFLVDANGAIMRANASGEAMLATGEAVRAIGNRLTITEPGREQALAEIVTTAEGGDAGVGRRGIAVPFLSLQGKRYAANILPLTSGARRVAGTRYSAVAAVFVAEAGREGTLPYEMIADHYRLTPAELRVLFGIVQIGGVPEVAVSLGVSEPTVKTHLQHVFEKTDTNRQADLVKLVTGYMSPLAATNGGAP